MILAETTGNPSSFFSGLLLNVQLHVETCMMSVMRLLASVSIETPLYTKFSVVMAMGCLCFFLDTQSIFLMLSRRGIKCHNKISSRRAVARQRVLVQLGTFLAIRIQIIILDGA